MNYSKIYNDLIEKGKSNVFTDTDYYETHHIIPKGLGGTDDKDNLVNLTYRQHFVAHWLLFRIYPDNKQIAAAFHISAFGTNCRNTRKKHQGYMPSSRAIAEARIAKVVHNKGNKHSPETIKKMQDTWAKKLAEGYVWPKIGTSPSEETRAKQSKSKIGKSRSQETIDKISETKKKQYQEYLEQNNGVKKKMSKKTKIRIKEAAIERNRIKRQQK